jgi:hypothetical protein
MALASVMRPGWFRRHSSWEEDRMECLWAPPGTGDHLETGPANHPYMDQPPGTTRSDQMQTGEAAARLGGSLVPRRACLRVE